MSMFCYQCQETLNNAGCTVKGVCGKNENVANLQDLMIDELKEIALSLEESSIEKINENGPFIMKALFLTITNVNFDENAVFDYIKRAINIKNKLNMKNADNFHDNNPSISDLLSVAAKKSILNEKDLDKRSLKELLIYGLKGVAAYTDHAYILGFENNEIYKFAIEALAATKKDLSINEYINLVNRCGSMAVSAMELLDRANTSTYGNPVITKVKTNVGSRPGILVSGHDLKDLYELLEQSKDQGIDIYTHSEMLPAHYYPKLKEFDHLYGNYGSSWWNQGKEFDSFNGPILMTTNCITNVKETYKSRFFTTGAAGWPETKHIKDRTNGGSKDFSEIIAMAKKCNPPTKLEDGFIVGGFAHNQLMSLSDSILNAVNTGKIKKFIVMAGCDGRHKSREYYSEVAMKLPKDTVILTAGCAKYRYNKLNLGEIDGIPRVIDAGQCNDSYSLAYIALKLKEILGLDDINKLPIAYDIAWYEQKAVCVLLGLLSLGVKGIRLGPTLPGFLTENVAKTLINVYDLKGIKTADEDIKEMLV